MYIPNHLKLDETRTRALLADADTVQLVTAHPDGPVATLLPCVYRPDEGWGSFVFHVTRTNSQWKQPHLGEVLAIVSGPDSYIDPQWRASYEDHATVPTWDYVTVHAYGEMIVHDDRSWSLEVSRDLCTRHGFDLDDVADDSLDRLVRAIVGLELRITRVEAKAKLGQSLAPDDVRGVIAGLRDTGGSKAAAVADAAEDIALPHAMARSTLVADIRAQRGSSR